MLRRQGRNRAQSGQIPDPLPDEGLDAVALFGRKFSIGKRCDDILQLAILRAYPPPEFRQSRHG